MEWRSAGLNTIVGLSPGATDFHYIVLPSQARAFTDPTLIRTRGQLAVMKSDLAQPLVGAVGIIAWSDRNDSIPAVGDRPGPFSDADLDWIWHSYLYGSSAQLHDLKWSEGFATSIDSRAMRKLGADQGVAFCIENFPGFATISYGFGARCLIKE